MGDGGPSWRLIPLEDADGWAAALDGLAAPVALTGGFRRAFDASAGRPTWLFSCRSATGRFVCPVAERSFRGSADLVTPYGFGGVVGEGDVGVFWAAWSELVAARGAVASYLGLHPLLAPASLAEDARSSPAGWVRVLDLQLSPRGLEARLSTNARRSLRHHETVAADLCTDQEALTETFVRLYPSFMLARGARPIYRLGSRSLEALCRIDQAFLLGYPKERPEAAALFAWTPSGGEWLFGVYPDTLRGILIHLVWAGAERMRALGVPWLDLGGGVSDADGVDEFKRRLGGLKVPFNALRLIHRPDEYARLTAEAGASPDSSYFPAYHDPDARMDRLSL